jgi:hypothetical protein
MTSNAFENILKAYSKSSLTFAGSNFSIIASSFIKMGYYNVTNDEFNILQIYTNEMYNFQVPDPQRNSMGRTIEEPKVGLLIKEASFAYIRQFNLLKQMIANQQIQAN